MSQTTAVHRIEVRPRPGLPDPKGQAARRECAASDGSSAPQRVDAAAVYLIEGELDEPEVRRIADELLADPVTELASLGVTPTRADALVEVHPLPGVTDPDADPVVQAIRAMLGREVRVRTGRRYDLHEIGQAEATRLAGRCLANRVIHGVYDEPYWPGSFPTAELHETGPVIVPMRDLDDDALQRLSREAHLFLSLDEMRAIREEYRLLGRDPRDIELETLAQTWSEHCVHKTLKATIRYEGPLPDYRGRPFRASDDGTIRIENLLGSTIAAATRSLIDDGIDWCLSVFVDNAGIIAFDDEHAVCFKCETHNHPSAIEPYGGAATGIGGCIRDIMGTGLAARPIAATDVFCVAFPGTGSFSAAKGTGSLSAAERVPVPGSEGAQPGTGTRSAAEREPVPSATKKVPVPKGCLPPRRILTEVVAGVRDYGNRMGIPTLNGAVWFDDDHVGNPLVFCGCVGVMPRDRVAGEAQAGDRIVAIGGRTGRDGIHGATFSSAELTDTHADEFSHAVQIGNPVTEKKALDAILAARDHPGGCLFSAITDCGAGGFSSAVGEMGEAIGAEVHLERAPLKYEGLTPTEIWISEAQERMVLAVPADRMGPLAEICRLHDVELCDLGHFGTPGRELVLHASGVEVGRLPMSFLHDGRPDAERRAAWTAAPVAAPGAMRSPAPAIERTLLRLLAHPNIASKHWIIRQYDHEVQGGSVIKPIVGPHGTGPSDAAVVLPVTGSTRGLAIANGLATGLRDDPYVMALAAIDECVRNLVCVGGDPGRIALLDNFCWPGCDDPRSLGELVRAAVACHDGAMAYRAPFISGKDSLNNQFTAEDGRTHRIPPTLLISGIGVVPDVRRCVTMDAKRAGNVLVMIGRTGGAAGGSHLQMIAPELVADPSLPVVDLATAPRVAAGVHHLIAGGHVRSAHDCSEGGLLVAAAEMCIAGGLGLELRVDDAIAAAGVDQAAACFAETPSRYLLEIEPSGQDGDAWLDQMMTDAFGRPEPGRPPLWQVIGRFDATPRVRAPDVGLDVAVDDLRRTWLAPLDW